MAQKQVDQLYYRKLNLSSLMDDFFMFLGDSIIENMFLLH